MSKSKKNRNVVDKERGSLVVEATIVFPVTFLIVIFLIFAGNVYYQRSRAQAIFSQEVISYAARESNPMLATFLDTGNFGSVGMGNDFKPYRYLNFSSRGGEIGSKAQTRLTEMGGGFFSGMETKNPVVTVNYKTYAVYAIVEAEMTYSIQMPIKLFGQDEAMTIDFEEYIEVPAMEGSEMVRNINMVRDLLARNKTASEIMEKAGGYISKFKSVAN